METSLGRPTDFIQSAVDKTLAPRTIKTYERTLLKWWRPFAQREGLPQEFRPETTPLDISVIESLLAYCTGELVKNSKWRNEESGPLALRTVESMLAALRWQHHRVGIEWLADTEAGGKKVRELRRGYADKYGQPKAATRPITAAALRTLLSEPQGYRSPNVFRLASALEFFRGPLGAQSVNLAGDEFDVQGSVISLWGTDIECTGNSNVRSWTCLHCALSKWQEHAGGQQLIAASDVDAYKAFLEKLKNSLPMLGNLDAPTLGDVARILPIVLIDPDTARWLRIRAAILLLAATGLSVNSLENLLWSDVSISRERVVLSVQNGTDPQTRLLEATGNILCPVAAIKQWAEYVRAHSPEDKTLFFTGFEGSSGKLLLQEGNPKGKKTRKLTQALNAFFRSFPELKVSTKSLQVGYIVQAANMGTDLLVISRIVGHKKPTTTMEPIARYADITIAADLLAQLKKHGPR